MYFEDKITAGVYMENEYHFLDDIFECMESFYNNNFIAIDEGTDPLDKTFLSIKTSLRLHLKEYVFER